MNRSIASVALVVFLAFPMNSSADTKQPTWVGSYLKKGGGGGMTVEKEGKKLWIEIWRDTNASGEKYEEVYYASVHGKTAKRLPFRGDICPETLTLLSDEIKLLDECMPGQPVVSYFERIK